MNELEKYIETLRIVFRATNPWKEKYAMSEFDKGWNAYADQLKKEQSKYLSYVKKTSDKMGEA